MNRAMKKHSKLLLWGIFLLLVAIYIQVLETNYVISRFVSILGGIFFVAAILFAGASWFMDYIDDEDDKKTGSE